MFVVMLLVEIFWSHCDIPHVSQVIDIDCIVTVTFIVLQGNVHIDQLRS